MVLVPSMIAMGLLFFALRFADPGAQLVLTIIAMGTFLYSMHAILIAGAMDVAGGEVQSTVVSLIYGAGFLGTMSPIIAGIIADAYGIPNAFLYGGAVVMVATVLLAVTKLPRTANQVANSGS
jgi:MFS family permease